MEKQNSSVLQEWRGIVDQCKSGKHANSQTAVKFSGILSSLLQSPDGVLGELLPDFSFLPSGTVGRAFAKTYGALPNEKRQAIWEWMGRQQPERRDAERTYALPGLIRGSSPYAFECLCDLKATNKEQRERLVSNLGEFSASTLSSIFETEEPEYKIRRVVNSLLAVAQEPRADLDFRAAILEAVAPAVRRYRWNTESALGK